MPLFLKENLCTIASSELTWKHIVSSEGKRSEDRLLLPYELNETEKTVCMEKIRHTVLNNGGDPAILKPYADFKGYAAKRRTDPTRGEWIWLYSQIVERHLNVSFQELVGIMACRDAFIPFFESIPNRMYYITFQQIFTQGQPTDSSSPIAYQSLEAAIQEDAPAKVLITKMLCRNVTDEEILNRAIALGKSAVVTSMLSSISTERIIKILTEAHTNWENPASLFERLLPQHEDEIAAWRDPWGNSFFWYLYRRPFLSRSIIEGLPPKILATFETKNRYELSPEDLWTYFRPSPTMP